MASTIALSTFLAANSCVGGRKIENFSLKIPPVGFILPIRASDNYVNGSSTEHGLWECLYFVVCIVFYICGDYADHHGPFQNPANPVSLVP